MGYYETIRARARAAAQVPGAIGEILMSDIQPDDTTDIATWRTGIVPQLPKYHGDCTVISLPGDLLDRGKADPNEVSVDYHFTHLYDDFGKAGWKRNRIFPISGNHDYNYGDIEDTRRSRTFHEFLRFNPRLFYYTVSGNIVRIYMGDMYASVAGEIPNYVIEWCERVIERHQKHFIALYIHQPIAGTLGTLETDDTVEDEPPGAHPEFNDVQLGSSRIRDMLTRQTGKIGIVVSGHLSRASAGGLTNAGVTSNEFKYGCWHVNVGLHIPSYSAYPANPMSFCRMDFVHGGRYVRVRRWDVLNKVYVPSKEFSILSSVPLELSNDFSYDGRYQWDERGSTMELDQGDVLFVTAQLDRVGGIDGAKTVLAEPQTLIKMGLQDRSSDDIPAGIGPAIDFCVPGGGADEGILRSLDSFGLSGRITNVKTSGTDTNYSADIHIYAGQAGKGSLIKTFEFMTTGNVNSIGRVGANERNPQGWFHGNGQNGGAPTFMSENNSQDIGVRNAESMTIGTFSTGGSWVLKNTLFF